ncbi:hypothetical protein M422DRAFT_149361 [Sphaerobolus stellatus SS14]|nr:hypothetical protein M422DRAFT_149361 [Sphaerobolus stellatus SS14]
MLSVHLSLFYATYNLASTPLIVSYTIYAKGFNIFNFMISLAIIFNQYINPSPSENLDGSIALYMCAGLHLRPYIAITSSLRPRTAPSRKFSTASSSSFFFFLASFILLVVLKAA